MKTGKREEEAPTWSVSLMFSKTRNVLLIIWYESVNQPQSVSRSRVGLLLHQKSQHFSRRHGDGHRRLVGEEKVRRVRLRTTHARLDVCPTGCDVMITMGTDNLTRARCLKLLRSVNYKLPTEWTNRKWVTSCVFLTGSWRPTPRDDAVWSRPLSLPPALICFPGEKQFISNELLRALCEPFPWSNIICIHGNKIITHNSLQCAVKHGLTSRSMEMSRWWNTCTQKHEGLHMEH